MKIKLTSVYVNDTEKAFNFYTQILGFQKLMYEPKHSLAIVVSPEDPNGTALLLEPNINPIAKKYQHDIYQEQLPAIILGTDNIEKEYERLKELGVVFKTKPTKTEWGNIAVFDDNCGNYIQLFQN